MRALRVRRRQERALVLRYGARPVQAQSLGIQAASGVSHADLMSLPQAALDALQVQDTGNPDFGRFYFLVDYSAVDGSDVIR